VSVAIYYLLTTGAGLQTLGEEYCDVLQVAGRPPHLPRAPMPQTAAAAAPASGALGTLLPVFDTRGPVAPAARVALALLQAVGPYVGERLAAALGRGGGGGDEAWAGNSVGSGWSSGWAEPPPNCSGDSEVEEDGWSDREEEEAGPSGCIGGGSSGGGEGWWGALLQRWPWRCQRRRRGRRRRHRRPSWHAPVTGSAAAGRVRAALEAKWPLVCAAGAFAGRVHLALFYLYGTYYHWEKRVLGVTHTSISPLISQRASYRVRSQAARAATGVGAGRATGLHGRGAAGA
jgi:peroxin-10